MRKLTKAEFTAQMDEKIKLVRTEYGLTQDKMALALGISKKTLVEIEKGRRSLGWTGAVACGVIFSESSVLQNEFGGEMTDLVATLALSELHPSYPKTMGGKIWWKVLREQAGLRLQQNIVSGHYRILDEKDCRILSSFDLDTLNERFERELAQKGQV